MNYPRVLIPFDRREALSLREAAAVAGRSVETVRRWCALNDIGRRIGGRWAVSHPALLMLLDGDREALKAYLAGERDAPAVRAYFDRALKRPPQTPQNYNDFARRICAGGA